MTDHSELIADLRHAAENSGTMDAGSWPRLCMRAVTTLREQAGEIERLTIDRDDFGKASADNWESFKRVRAERDALASENAGLRKDAERYRRVREIGPYNWAPWSTAEAMDTAIDAAMAAAKP